MRYLKNVKLMATVAVATMATSVVAEERLTASAGFPGTSILSSVDYTDFTMSVEKATAGDITFDLHVGGALLPIATSLEGIRDGIADVGNVVAAYIPASLPKNNVVADIGFALDDHMASAFAVTEMNIKNAALQAEWAEYDVVFGGGFSTPPYLLMCVTPIRSVADVEGKKIRTASGSHVELIKTLGGEPVSVPFTDVYTGMERGSLDCVLSSAENLGTAYTLWDVVTSVTVLPLGTHISGGAWIYNQSTWGRLSVDQRKSLLNEMAIAGVHRQMAYDVEITRSLEGSWEKGIERIEPDEGLATAVTDFKAAFIKDLPAASESKRKVPEAEAKALVDEFQKIYSRWEVLLEGVDRSDEDALVKIVKSEIYDKVDPAKYGL